MEASVPRIFVPAISAFPFALSAANNSGFIARRYCRLWGRGT